jgi:EpsI family protein
VDHLIYGWVFFGIVIMLMFLVGARWSEPEPAPALPGSIANASGLWVSPAKWMFAVVSVLTVLAAPMAARWAINDSAHARATPVLAAPAQFSGGWTSATQLVVVWQPAFNNPSAHFQADYVRDDKSVGLYLGYYHRQNSESKLVGSENALVKSKDPQWVHVSGGSRSIEANGKPVAVRTAELRGAPLAGQASENRLVVWQIYWVNGTLTASDIKAKALTAVYSLLGRGDDSAVIIVYAPKGEGGQGEATLSEFMRDNLTPIQMLLEKANPTP